MMRIIYDDVDISLIFATIGVWIMIYDIITHHKGFSLGMAIFIGGGSYAFIGFKNKNNDKSRKNSGISINQILLLLIIIGFCIMIYIKIILAL